MPSVVRILIRWGIFGYVAYLLLCLLVLMPVLNIMAPRLTKTTINRELHSELLLINPFTLTLEARDVTLAEASGHSPLGFKSLRINLSLESLWSPGVVLDGFYIEQVDLHVLRHADGAFHFADLVGDRTDEEEPNTQTELPGITVHDVLIEAHTLRFTDETRPGPYTTAQTDFRLRTQNLTTVPDRRSTGALEITGDGGGLLRWQGELEVAAGNSHGQITLEDINLTHIWRYDAETHPFVVNSARFNAILNYSVDWREELQATLSDSELRLRATDISPADMLSLPDTGITLSELAVTGISADLREQSVDLAAVSVAGLNLSGFDEQGDPSLLHMFLPPAARDTLGETPSEPEENDADRNDVTGVSWTVSLGAFELSDSEVLWRTDYLAPEIIRVSPLNAQMTDIHWPAQARAPFTLALGLNQTSSLDIAGDINLDSGEGDTRIDLKQWSLPWLNPLVTEQTRATIGRGALSLQSTLSLRAFAPTAVAAQLQIDDYSTVLEETGEEAFTFAGLNLDGIAVDVENQSVDIESFVLDRPAGSLHIREDGTININGIVRSRPNTAPTPEQDAAVDAPGNPAEQAPWRVNLADFRLRDGRLDFADASLPLPFKTIIDGIEADIRNIDTASEQTLNVEFKGTVDGYAPVVILGSGKPFAEQRDGELHFTFRGMDIASMSPYAGTYAGYSLKSGTLSLDLRYGLDGQTLKGDNRIVISQMELGEPVESELAIKAPLKLGIALLTDRNGVIDLSVPISGNVDSPGFSLGPIIGTAIKNIIVKAVTAPFSLLANLVGSDDDLEYIGFAAGSSGLDRDAQGALEALGEALTARPQLRLRIAGGADGVSDAMALKEKLLRDKLLAEGIDATMIDAQSEAFVEALDALYRSLPAPSVTDGDQNVENAAIDPALMWREVVNSTPLPKTALQDLATARAAIAKRELVTTGGIDPARIAISFDAKLAQSSVQMRVDS